MSFHHFPHDFVFWDKVENHEKIKSDLLPEILKKNEEQNNNPFEACELNTSFYRDHRLETENNFLKNEKILRDIVFIPIANMLNKYNELNLNKVVPGTSIVQCGWWNVYKKGEFQEMHAHKTPPFVSDNKLFYPSFSIIYILNDDNEDSTILFRKDHVPMKEPGDDYTFKTSKEQNISEGTVLIFPYDLNHMVKPCVKPGRVTIAYNVYSTWKIS